MVSASRPQVNGIEPCNPVGSGSATIGVRDSTVRAGKFGFAWIFTCVMAAMEMTAPARADIDVRTEHKSASRMLPISVTAKI